MLPAMELAEVAAEKGAMVEDAEEAEADANGVKVLLAQISDMKNCVTRPSTSATHLSIRPTT
jgi:hypothetical protein